METEKNKLDNLLRNNLLRKQERIRQEIQEMTGEDRNQKLEMNVADMEVVNERINENNVRFRGENHTCLLWNSLCFMFYKILILFLEPSLYVIDYNVELDKEIEKLNKDQRALLNQLESWKSKEREQQDRISEDAKELDKMTNKQSLLLKKVSVWSL